MIARIRLLFIGGCFAAAAHIAPVAERALFSFPELHPAVATIKHHPLLFRERSLLLAPSRG
jgi:hypothetical protein